MRFEKLNEIENTNGSNAKKELLKEFLEDADNEEWLRMFFEDTQYNISKKTFSKAMSYGGDWKEFKDVGDMVKTQCHYNEELNINQFKLLIEEVKKKSGNELIEFLKEAFKNLHSIQAKWFSRFFVKNLSCGMNLALVNKTFKELNKEEIKKFEVQLCGKLEVEDFDKIEYPVQACVKYDGFRCFVKKLGDKITFTSRQGKNVEFLPELEEFFKHFDIDFILDGEVMAKDFNSIQKRIGRKLDNIKPVEGLHFRCFDIIEYNGQELYNMLQNTRSQFITQHIKFMECELFKLEESMLIENKEALAQYYKLMCDRKEEGIIVKDLNKPYEFNGRKNWFKVKPIFENTFKIVDCAYGTGKNKDIISKLTIVDESGLVSSNVGSGLSDELLVKINQMHSENTLIGSYIDIMYNEITSSNGKYSLRFPRVLKLRFDKERADNLIHLISD